MVRDEEKCIYRMDLGTEMKWIEWIDFSQNAVKVVRRKVVLSHGFRDDIANHFDVSEIREGSTVRCKEVSILK